MWYDTQNLKIIDLQHCSIDNTSATVLSGGKIVCTLFSRPRAPPHIFGGSMRPQNILLPLFLLFIAAPLMAQVPKNNLDVHHTAVLRRVSHQCKCQRSSGDSNIHCNCAVSHALKTRISTARPQPTPQSCAISTRPSSPRSELSYHIRNVPGLSTIEMSPGYHAGEKAGVFIFCQPCLQG